MKTITQRKGMVAGILLAAVLLWVGGNSVRDGITHVGPGAWLFGGSQDSTGTDEDEFWEVIPEHQYKRECYVSAVMFFVFGGGILWGVILKWKERNELEESWKQIVSNPENLQDVRNHPGLYRDDFKKWINENHPNSEIWIPPERLCKAQGTVVPPDSEGIVCELADVRADSTLPKTQVARGTLILHVNPELDRLRQLVAGARSRLAGLESDYTKQKLKVDEIRAILFCRLREHYQRRDEWRLVVEYRKKYLNALLRGGGEEAREAEAAYENARSQTKREYEETASAAAARTKLTAAEESELTGLWKKLVKLYHPDRFASEPYKLETYHKLTSAINRAKEDGDIKTLREIAEDPHGFILRQGWTGLDFGDAAELTQLRRLHETLQLEIIAILESLNQLHESPDYELSQISEKQAGILDELVGERARNLDNESAELENQAKQLAGEIEQITGRTVVGIG